MLTVNHLSKSFGNVKAVDDLSFHIEPGTILGMIGQNGSGKTTTFRLILNFLTADKGEVLWQNRPLTKQDYNHIGYLPEERGLYLKATIEEQLYYFAALRGRSRKETNERIDYWMEMFQVKGKRKDKIKTLSKGNQQKVQVISTLLHEPKLLILDEPFSGLDPVNAELLKRGVNEMRQNGSTVIFSSHNMENVSELCDAIVMLRHGKTVLNGTVQDVRESFGRTRLALETPVPLTEIQQIPGVLQAAYDRQGTMQVQLADESVGRDIFSRVAASGYVQMFSQQPPTLEEIFKLKAGEPHEEV